MNEPSPVEARLSAAFTAQGYCDCEVCDLTREAIIELERLRDALDTTERQLADPAVHLIRLQAIDSDGEWFDCDREVYEATAPWPDARRFLFVARVGVDTEETRP